MPYGSLLSAYRENDVTAVTQPRTCPATHLEAVTGNADDAVWRAAGSAAQEPLTERS